MQAQPIFSRCSVREDAEGVETSREALLVGVWFWIKRRVVGKPKDLKGSGSVLGQPLKRILSP